MPTVLDSSNYKKCMHTKVNALIDFSAEWCGPCKRMEPLFKQAEKFIKELSTDIEFYSVDVDDSEDIAGFFKIEAMPTLILVKDGKIVERAMGFRDCESILILIGKHFDFPRVDDQPNPSIDPKTDIDVNSNDDINNNNDNDDNNDNDNDDNNVDDNVDNNNNDIIPNNNDDSNLNVIINDDFSADSGNLSDNLNDNLDNDPNFDPSVDPNVNPTVDLNADSNIVFNDESDVSSDDDYRIEIRNDANINKVVSKHAVTVKNERRHKSNHK